ncbi:MAG TPA: hypothetical protein VF980_12850 [Thermoanaerobaculia bacterium]
MRKPEFGKQRGAAGAMPSLSRRLGETTPKSLPPPGPPRRKPSFTKPATARPPTLEVPKK